MNGLPEVALPLEVAVDLCHALAARLAEESGVRVVGIKGPTLAMHGLREARVSSDVDVLVDPKGFEKYCAAFERIGWVERNARVSPSVLPPHSRTFVNPEWPCDVDVHWYYPGLFADANEVFERFWLDHVVMWIANYPVPVASKAASVVIAALHDMRNPGSLRHESELEELGRRVAGLSREDLTAVSHLAVVWRAQSTLGAFLDGQGMRRAVDLSPRELMAWRIKVATSEDGTTAGWLVAALDATWSARISLLWRALWPSGREMKLAAVATPQTQIQLVRARMGRLRRALRSMPHVIRVVLEERALVRRGSRSVGPSRD